MAQVTVSSGNFVSIAAAAAGSDALALQTSIAAAINSSGTLAAANYFTDTLTGGGAAPAPPSGATFSDAYINDAGGESYTVSSSYSAVLYNPTAADTVYLNPGQSVLGGTVGGTFIGIGGDTLALGGGNNLFVSSVSGSLPPSLEFENPDYVVGGAGNDTLFGGNGGTLDGGAGNNILWAGSDTAGTTFISSGTDLVVGGGGTDFATVSGANSTVLAGSGTLNLSVSGSADTIGALNASQVSATLSGSNTFLFGQTAGALSVLDNGTGDTVVAQGAATVNETMAGGGGAFYGGSGSATVTAASSTALVVGGTGNLTFLGNSSVATVVGSAGGTTSIVGSGGGLQVSARTGNTTISGGTGAVTLFGGSGSNVTFTDTAHQGLLYLAGTGNETLDASGSNGNDSLFGGTQPGANLLIKAGSGNDTMTAGPGNDTLVAGSGKDLFAFFNGAGGGQDFINGLTSNDTVALAGYSLSSLVSSLQNAQVTAQGVKITLSDNTSITFSGLSSLTGQNII